MLYVLSPLETAYRPRGTRTQFILKTVKLPPDQIVLVTSDFDHSSKAHLEAEAIQGGNTVRTIVLHAPGYRKNVSWQRVRFQLVFTFRASVFLLRNVRRNDLILTMLSFPELTIANWLCARFRGARNAVDIWDIWPDALVGVRDGKLARLFATYCNTIYRLSLRHFDRLFYVAPSFLHWTRRFDVPDARTEFVPLGYDSERWRPRAAEKPSPGLRLAYVGYLAAQFDLGPLLDAIDPDSSVQLEILGDGPQFAAYKARRRNDAVALRGHVSFAEVEARLAASQIGVLPLARGAGAELPNKFFDYLGAGLPVLVLGGSDAGAIVERMDLGWHLPQDSAAIRSFLGALTPEDIAHKQHSVAQQRERFSKESLYAPLLSYLEAEA